MLELSETVSKIFFALFLYNESVMVSSLTYNVKFTLNIKPVILKML